MRLIKIAFTTVAATIAGVAAVIGVDWAWQTGASSQLMASTFGDPTIVMAAPLPPDPQRVDVYRIARPLVPAEVQKVIPGRVHIVDGYLFWRGESRLTPVQAMRQLNPGVPWRADAGRLGPAPPGRAHGSPLVDCPGRSPEWPP